MCIRDSYRTGESDFVQQPIPIQDEGPVIVNNDTFRGAGPQD